MPPQPRLVIVVALIVSVVGGIGIAIEYVVVPEIVSPGIVAVVVITVVVKYPAAMKGRPITSTTPIIASTTSVDRFIQGSVRIQRILLSCEG